MCTCTNLQKVIENLQSRQTIIKINTLKKDSIKQILDNSKKKENIVIDDKSVLTTILNLSNNSVGIMLNYMDKCRLLKKINVKLQSNFAQIYHMNHFIITQILFYSVNIRYQIMKI